MSVNEWTCLFCGRGRPDVRISHEHGVPKWIKRIPSIAETIELAPSAKYREVPITRYDVANQRRQTELIKTSTKALHVTQMTLKVCETCNTGWMSQLETKVKPILTPAIEGESKTLSLKEAHTVSIWASKTAAVAELDLPEVQMISNRQRAAIMRGEMPPGFAVYSARASVPEHFTWVTRPGERREKLQGKVGDRLGTHVGVAMSPGHVVLLVRAIQPGASMHVLARSFPALSPAWQQLWPPTTRTGPALFHTDQDVDPAEARAATGKDDLPMQAN
jgi:hypothetical protein